MKYTIIVKPLAELDMREAALWYEKEKANLGIEFLEAVEEKLKIIESNPQLFEVKYKEVHRAFLNRFPFAIHYKVEEQNIFILAVLHTSLNPKIWKTRNK